MTDNECIWLSEYNEDGIDADGTDDDDIEDDDDDDDDDDNFYSSCCVLATEHMPVH